MRSYELMMIHRPELAETEVRAQVSELETAIAESGTVADSDFWGKRRFSYEIDHIREGYYSVVEFQGDTELVQRIDRALSLSDIVVRHKILRSPKG
jgi:small subunit ribosomal protein S6